MIEVFELEKPPLAIAYGWAVEGDGERDYISVSGKPPFVCGLFQLRRKEVSDDRSIEAQLMKDLR